jgi:c-di-GMP-binding flagellar brake protein YcgR
MLTGIINRRIANRAPVQSDVKIDFRDSIGEAVVLATATNISAGGMQFSLPAQTLLLNIGDKISFIFQLPDYGEITVLSEVRYRNIHPGNSAFEAHYGVKFLDFSLDNWNSIRNYCDLNKEAPLTDPLCKSPKNGAPDSPVLLKTTIELEDGLTLEGSVEDLSFGGARINLEQPLKINSRVTLAIYYQEIVLKLTGYCIWCAPEKMTPQLFLAGIFFPNLDQTQFDQLKLLINKTS